MQKKTYNVREIRGYCGEKIVVKRKIRVEVKDKASYEEFLYNKYRKLGVLVTYIEAVGFPIENKGRGGKTKINPKTVYDFIIENPQLDFIAVGYRFGISHVTVKKYFNLVLLMNEKAPE